MRVVATLFKPVGTIPEWSRNSYGPWYADRLARSVRKHAPSADVVILTDYPSHEFIEPVRRIPFVNPERGWSCLMEMFRPEAVGDGPALLVGLDTAFVGPLDEIFETVRRNGIVAPLDPYLKPRITNAVVGVMAPQAAAIWTKWQAERVDAMKCRRWFWNGAFSEMLWLAAQISPETFDAACPGAVLSYKANVGPGPEHPADARIIFFHGMPKPHHLAIAGVPWLVRNWGA